MSLLLVVMSLVAFESGVGIPVATKLLLNFMTLVRPFVPFVSILKNNTFSLELKVGIF